MGGAALTIITEGRIDRTFYGSLMRVILRSRPHITSTIRTAKELPGGSGGKSTVLTYFDFIKRRRRLASVLGGKKSVVVFCLDKDLDDLTRKMRRSPHVIYTETFDVENYLFLNSNIAEAAAAATTVDAESIREALAPIADWPKRAAERWKDWVAVCVFEITGRYRSSGNYGVCPSPIHHASGALNRGHFAQRLALIENNSGLSPVKFNRRWQSVKRAVNRQFECGGADKVFKGKWYGWLLARDLTVACAGRDADCRDLEKRLTYHLCQSLDFGLSWSESLCQKFAALLDQELPAPA
jgi:Protein of unknown function (DUF4435)